MALRATFIGVGKYSDPGIRDLVGATRDAIAFHALFVDSMPDCPAQLLVDGAATRNAIRNALAQSLGTATEDDTVVVSFSGHGSHDHRLAATDTKLNDLEQSTVSMSEVADLFKQSEAHAILLVLDCCFSGGAPAKVLEDSPFSRDPSDPYELLVGKGRILIAASESFEVAYESPQTRHGLLTKALLDILMTAEGSVDLLGAAVDIMHAVRAESARLGVVQTPVVLGSVQGGLLLPRLKPGVTFFAAFPEYAGIRISSDIRELTKLGLPLGVVDAWAAKYSNGLNGLQLEAVNEYRITEGSSLVVVAPTSSGKTFIGEIAAAKAITEGRKTLFLLPYRALVNEKFDQFSALYADSLGLRVIRCTGDYSDQVSSLLKGKYDLAILTYEMFLQLVVSSPVILNQLGLIVLDEAQFITDPTRGMAVELLLTFVQSARERGMSPQLIALSAVIGDVNNFQDWLQCRLLMSTSRPVPLIEGVIDRDGVFQFIDENGKEKIEQYLSPWEVRVRREKPSAQDLLVPLVRKLVNDKEKVIVFRNTRGPAQGCANYLAAELGLASASEVLARLPEGDQSGASAGLRQALAGGVAFHNSNLTREERIVVEQAFRDPDGLVRVLAATTTVAAGINTPASTVILAENEFVGEDGRAFTVAEYKNMAGRAGRLGFNERGKSIVYAENSMERQALFHKYIQGRLERLESSFDPRDLDTWVVRLLVQVNHISRADVPRLLANTYAGYLQNRANPGWRKQIEHDISALLDRMINLQLVDVAGDMISLSLLGRACGRSSLSFASAMRLVEIVKTVSPQSLTATNLVALMQGLPQEEMGYTPLMKKGTKETIRVQQAASRFGYEVVNVLQRYAQDIYEYYARCKRAAILFDWISGRKIDEIEGEFTTTPYTGKIEHGDIRRFADTTRFHLRAAADILLVLVPTNTVNQDIDVILTRLETGLPEGALDLLLAPINLTRGECIKIFAAGISKVEDLMRASEDDLIAMMGKTRAKLLEEARPKEH